MRGVGFWVGGGGGEVGGAHVTRSTIRVRYKAEKEEKEGG